MTLNRNQLSTLINPKAPLFWIAVFAIGKLILHTLVNHQYGFHRDELQTLDDARHLAWGYVAYPPVTPFVGRLGLLLFGESLAGFRFFAAMAQSIALVLTADMARRMGGDRAAQWLAAIAVAISPVSLSSSSLLQYVSFDYLWWVLLAWLIVRLVISENPRCWIAIGAVIGLGFLTKYTIVFVTAGLFVGFIGTPLRRQIRSPWLWAGVVLALIVASPNLIWQVRHDFITFEFLKSIHARDIRIGRTDHFLINQLWIPANAVTVPLWAAGICALFASSLLRRFRILGCMAVITIILFAVARGRDYYTAPVYPMLFAGGAVWLLNLIRAPIKRRLVVPAGIVIMLMVGALLVAVQCPIAPVGSNWWRKALAINGDLREEMGWPELVAEIARIRDTLPEEKRARTAILCTNYGEAGAINLYGPRYGLPPAISGVNSFHARGFGDPPPELVIVIGGRRERLEQRFETVELIGQVPNPFGVPNEESERPDIFLCGPPRSGWPALWSSIRGFG